MANTANPMPTLSPEEYGSLKASIEREGFLVPIIVSAGPVLQGQIVDGFNRAQIAQELKIELPRISKRFESEAEFRIAQIDANIARRQLTLVQRVQLAMLREPWERQLARIREREGAKKGAVAKSRQQGNGSVAASEPIRATAEAAAAVGLKRDTYEHAKFVLQKAPAEIREQLVAGKISVDRAYRDSRRATGVDSGSVVSKSVAKRWGKLPSGTFGAIVCTPPWREGSKKFEAGRVLPAELAALDVRGLAKKDAVVALVTPGGWLREALELVGDKWGARIVSVVVRVRAHATGGGPIAERVDFAVIGTIGKAVLPESGRTNLVESDAQFYSLIDKLVPDAAGIRLFGEIERAGWTSWNPAIK